MSHAVHFQDASGASRLEDAPSLAAALERVEDLRNAEGATGIRVFREVPIEVRTYYRVVAVDEAATDAGPSPVGDPTGPGSEQDADVAVTPSVTASVSPSDRPTAAPSVAPTADMAPATPAPPMQPPSGAMVMSRQPVAVAAEPADGEPGDGVQHDHRRLFTRSS